MDDKEKVWWHLFWASLVGNFARGVLSFSFLKVRLAQLNFILRDILVE